MAAGLVGAKRRRNGGSGLVVVEPEAKRSRLTHFRHDLEKEAVKLVREADCVDGLSSKELSRGVSISYATTSGDIESWLTRHRTKMGEVVGFDVEWRPTFRSGAPINRVSVLQLCVGSEVLVASVNRLSRLPRALQSVLGDASVALVGVGAVADAVKLSKDWGVRVVGAKDVEVKHEGNLMSLQNLAQSLFHTPKWKSKKLSLSNWERVPLSAPQLTYAALDAFWSFWIHREIEKRLSRHLPLPTPLPRPTPPPSSKSPTDKRDERARKGKRRRGRRGRGGGGGGGGRGGGRG